MARDRLAAMRAQQQQQHSGGYGEQSYPSQSDNYDGGRSQRPQGGQTNQYEMSQVTPGDDMSAFYEEIESIKGAIKQLKSNVTSIGDLHSRSLNNMDDATAQRNNTQLERLVEDTSRLSGDLKRRIKTLESKGASGRDGAIRKSQTGLVKSQFVEALQEYQEVEKNYRQKYKGRMERQFRIVKPDATDEEVKAVVNDDSGGQIFSQALMNSNRYGESRAAYREVQERHADIKRIEKTLTELAQLFQDMAAIVDVQDETLNTIEAHAEQVHNDMEHGVKEVDTAVKHAAAARRKRWICFWIILAIIVVVAIIITVVVLTQKK